MHSNVHSSIIYNSQDMEATQMSIDRWMDEDDVVFIHNGIIFHCIYVPQLLYPSICRWTSRLLPCSSYCKQCCGEQWDTCVFFQFWFPQGICLGVGLLGHMVVLFIVFKEISVLSVTVSIYIPTNSARVFPFLHTLSRIYCLQTF